MVTFPSVPNRLVRTVPVFLTMEMCRPRTSRWAWAKDEKITPFATPLLVWSNRVSAMVPPVKVVVARESVWIRTPKPLALAVGVTPSMLSELMTVPLHEDRWIARRHLIHSTFSWLKVVWPVESMSTPPLHGALVPLPVMYMLLICEPVPRREQKPHPVLAATLISMWLYWLL